MKKPFKKWTPNQMRRGVLKLHRVRKTTTEIAKILGLPKELVEQYERQLKLRR